MLTVLPLIADESMFEIVAKGGLEAVVAAMQRFPKHAMVQAAGCWLFSIVSAKNGRFERASTSDLLSLLLLLNSVAPFRFCAAMWQKR